MRGNLVWSCCVTALLAAETAGAQATTEEDHATQLIARGIELREQGNDAQALTDFEDAERIFPSARAQAQVALAEQALGRWIDAETGLVASLQSSADPWIAKNRAALEDALATVRHQLGWLAVSVAPAGTATPVSDGELWVDGKQAASLPLSDPLRVVAGVLVIEVRAPGWETAAKHVEVLPEEHHAESFALRPTNAARPAPTTASTFVPIVPPVTAEAPPAGSRTATWVSLAAGGAFLAGGIVATVVQRDNAAVYDDDGRCLAGGRARDANCGSYGSTARIATALAVVGYAGAGVAAALSAVFYVRSVRAARRGTRTEGMDLRCALGPLGAACGGHF
jgi:hypothetical protein